MKKLCCLLLTLCITLSLAACSSTMYVPQENISFNYNNLTTQNSDFWLTNEAIYYIDPTFHNEKYYRMTADEKNSIASTDGAAIAHIHEYNNILYMVDRISANPDWPYDSIYKLHSYNTKTDTHIDLTELQNVTKYFIVGQDFYYLQENTSLQGNITYSFRVHSLEVGTDVCLAEDVLTAGVINGQPVFITQDDDIFSIYSYDSTENTSSLFDSFAFQIAKNGETIGSDFNFTSNQFLFTVNWNGGSKLVCYDFETENIAEYQAETYREKEPVDNHIYTVTAYEDYAFMVICENFHTGSGDDYENVIYRICLENGEMEKIAEVNGDVDTFVGSDDCVYIVSSSEPDSIYRYDASGEKTLVCTL